MEPLTAIGGGYGATKVAMAKTLQQIGGKMALGLMVGGGKKRKQLRRRKSSRHTKRISRRRVMSVKKMYKKKKQTKRLKRRSKIKEAKKDIIKSIEYGKPISKKSFSSLSPSVQSFLAGIESGSQSGSTIRFSDFKTKSNKGKKKVNSRPRTRGGGSKCGGRIRGGGKCDGHRCMIHKGGGCGGTCPGRN
tara:strand:- start:2976 stop:3545 length:570 start_codon:yes stop_codon:yes gene_type:complete